MPLSKEQVQAKLRAKFGTSSGRIGGKGAVRRKYKAAPKAAEKDDKKLSAQLKRLNVNPIPAIDEVNLFKTDGSVVHFNKPRVQTDLASHVYVVTGPHETKKIEEMIPEILPQLGRESFEQLKNFASQLPASMSADTGGVPSLIDDNLNFEEIAKSDEKTEATESSEKTEAEDAADAAAGDATVSSAATDEDEKPAESADAGADGASASAGAADASAGSAAAADSAATDAAGSEEAPKSLEPDNGASVDV